MRVCVVCLTCLWMLFVMYCDAVQFVRLFAFSFECVRVCVVAIVFMCVIRL